MITAIRMGFSLSFSLSSKTNCLKLFTYFGNFLQYLSFTLLRRLLCSINVLSHQTLIDAQPATNSRSVQLWMREENKRNTRWFRVFVFKTLKRHVLVKLMPMNTLIVHFVACTFLIRRIAQTTVVEQGLPQRPTVICQAINAVIIKPNLRNLHLSHSFQNNRSTFQ